MVIRYREKKIKTFAELKNTITTMDLDCGIRILGNITGFAHGGFIFITKMGEQYTVNMTERVLFKDGKTLVPGGRANWFYTDDSEKTWLIIKDKLLRPFEAWIY